jgi:hypothetical protein
MDLRGQIEVIRVAITLILLVSMTIGIGSSNVC